MLSIMHPRTKWVFISNPFFNFLFKDLLYLWVYHISPVSINIDAQFSGCYSYHQVTKTEYCRGCHYWSQDEGEHCNFPASELDYMCRIGKWEIINPVKAILTARSILLPHHQLGQRKAISLIWSGMWYQ